MHGRPLVIASEAKQSYSLLLILCCLLATGCTATRLVGFRAESPEQAFAEFQQRRERVTAIHSSVQFEFVLTEGSFTANGTIDYSRETGWVISLIGPFGMQLATLESSGEWYYLTLPQTAQVRQGTLRDGIDIPEIGVYIPPIERLDRFFMPTPDLSVTEGWLLMGGKNGDDGALWLKKQGILARDSLALTTSYIPLRVMRERWFYASAPTLLREYGWSAQPKPYPRSIHIELAQLKINLTYNSLRVESVGARPVSPVGADR